MHASANFWQLPRSSSLHDNLLHEPSAFLLSHEITAKTASLAVLGAIGSWLPPREHAVALSANATVTRSRRASGWSVSTSEWL